MKKQNNFTGLLIIAAIVFIIMLWVLSILDWLPTLFNFEWQSGAVIIIIIGVPLFLFWQLTKKKPVDYHQKYTTKQWNNLAFEEKCRITAYEYVRGERKILWVGQGNDKYMIAFLTPSEIKLYNDSFIIPSVDVLENQWLDDNCVNKETVDKVISYIKNSF